MYRHGLGYKLASPGSFTWLKTPLEEDIRKFSEEFKWMFFMTKKGHKNKLSEEHEVEITLLI